MQTLYDVKEKASDETLGHDIFELKNGRTFGFAEYGSLVGIAIMAFHGMPGSRLIKVADKAASTVGARIMASERPGYGFSESAPSCGNRE